MYFHSISKHFHHIYFILIGVVFAIGISVWAFTEPTQPPPAGNVPAPINVSGTAQTKTGDFTVNGKLNASGSLCIGDDCRTSWSQVGSLWSQSGSDIYYDSGKVGVGTDSPQAKLHLLDTAASDQSPLVILGDGFLSDRYQFLADQGGGAELFMKAGLARLRSDGELRLLAKGDASIRAEGFTFDVRGADLRLNASAWGRGDGGRALVHDVGDRLVFNYANDFADGVRINLGAGGGVDRLTSPSDNTYLFRSNPGGSYQDILWQRYQDRAFRIYNFSTGKVIFDVRQDGNVGIKNEATSLAALNFDAPSGTTLIRNSQGQDNIHLFRSAPGGSYQDILWQRYQDRAFRLYNFSTGQVLFDVLQDGRVQIGPGGPGGAMLKLDAGGNVFGIWAECSGLCDGIRSIGNGSIATGVSASGGFADFWAMGPGQDYGSASSIRWKENITPIDSALAKVLDLRGVYFDWKEKYGGSHDIGLIGEEVAKVLPEIVLFEEGGEYVKGIDYGKLTPLLIEAVKEQQKEIELLKMRIEKLENGK